MKKLVILSFALAATFLLGCQKETASNTEGNVSKGEVISFNAEIDESQEVQSVSSRSASKESFVSGDQIGVFVVPFLDASTPGTLFSNENFADNVPFSLASTRFYPTSGNSVSFPTAETKVSLYAFAMYHTQYNKLGTDNPAAVEWTIDTDQSTQDLIRKNDVMTAQALTVSQSDDVEPTLTFAHRLSIAQIEFTAPNTLRGSQVSTVEVSLSSFKNKVTLNMTTNDVVPTVDQTSTTNFAAYQASKVAGSTTTSYVFEAIVAPQTIAPGKQIAVIKFTTQDNVEHEYVCEVPVEQDGGGIVFQTATRTKLAITFNTEADVLLVGTSQIDPWNDTDPISLQVSRPFRLLFNVESGSKTIAATVASASLSIDGSSAIDASVIWDETESVLECKFVLPYNQFPDKLTALSLVNGSGLALKVSSNPDITAGVTIPGDPMSQDYNTKISTLTLSN